LPISRTIPLRSIQILRALAATLVVVGHAFHDSIYIADKTGQPPIEFPYFDWGFGVDIFFVISGFIMIYTTADSFGRAGAASTFIERRFVRIAPLYWLMTGLIIVVAAIVPKYLNVPIENWRSIVTSYLFVPDIRGNGEVRPILAAGWTLNYEMFFYAIFACCLMLPLRRGVLLLGGLFTALAILGSTVTLPGLALPFWANSIILEFVLGIVIGLACLSRWSLSAKTALTLTAIAILLAIAGGPIWGCNQILPRFVCAGFPAALLVTAAALWPALSPTRLVAALVAVGDASYSLYLTHPFVLRPLRNIWIALHGGSLPLGLYVIACVVVAVTGAIVIYRLIEKPLTGALQRRLRRQPKPRGEMVAVPNPATAPLSAP
jgi:exopolysaccharide production protein ExoZ